MKKQIILAALGSAFSAVLFSSCFSTTVASGGPSPECSAGASYFKQSRCDNISPTGRMYQTVKMEFENIQRQCPGENNSVLFKDLEPCIAGYKKAHENLSGRIKSSYARKFYNIPAKNPLKSRRPLKSRWAEPSISGFRNNQCDRPVQHLDNNISISVTAGEICVDIKNYSKTRPYQAKRKMGRMMIAVGTEKKKTAGKTTKSSDLVYKTRCIPGDGVTYTIWEQTDRACFKNNGLITGKTREVIFYQFDRKKISWKLK